MAEQMADMYRPPVRSPFPTDGDFSQLDGYAKTILGMMSKGLPMGDFHDLARDFIDKTIESKKPSVGRSNIRYANPDVAGLSRNIGTSYGEFNPDRIPIRTYEKMRMHPQIAIATSLIELQILAQGYRVECNDETIRRFVEEAIKPIYRRTNKSMLRAVQFGFACGEKIYKKKQVKIVDKLEGNKKHTVYNDMAVVIERIKFAHPISIRVIRNKKTEEIQWVSQELNYVSGGKKKKIRRAKIVWFALDDEYGNVFGNARYKNSYQPWYWHNIMTQFMLRYFERKGAPGVVVKAPLGTRKKIDENGNQVIVDNLDEGLKAGVSFISNSVIAIPREYDKDGNELWEIEIKEDKGRGGMFIEVLQYLNKQMGRGMFIPDQVATSEGTGGTNATSESHLDVHMISEESLIQDLEAPWNEQIIPDFIRFNFPPDKQVPCTIKIDRLNFSKKTLLRDVFTRMIILSGSAMKLGKNQKYMPDMKKLAEELEIPTDLFDELFLSEVKDDGKTDEIREVTPAKPKSNPEDVEDGEQEQKVQDRNKDATPRKDRPMRERKARERI